MRPVATLGGQLRVAAWSVFEALWPGREELDMIARLAQWLDFAPTRIETWKESAARVGAEETLYFVLSWSEGVDLQQLEHWCATSNMLTHSAYV
jgi:hypothetical protein